MFATPSQIKEAEERAERAESALAAREEEVKERLRVAEQMVKEASDKLARADEREQTDAGSKNYAGMNDELEAAQNEVDSAKQLVDQERERAIAAEVRLRELGEVRSD